ncbi:hypothetical protein [Corallococcus sp. CA054B]|uniref:hypothetical protein n=1 Tax=Corallococcus sp. CA054B TaxID=2316734 RepID=UPI0018F2A51C|nr:hypothetical protein [Corallococcus sp. CA054B]
MLGGACAYGIARAWGRPVIRQLTSENLLARYEERISRRYVRLCRGRAAVGHGVRGRAAHGS